MRTSEIVNLFPDTDFHAVPAVLDHLSAGVALLDRRLHVQFANKAFRAMTNDGALALRGRTLSSAWPASARQFDRMTRSALQGAPGGTMAIPHPGDGRLITILVAPAQGRTLEGSVGLGDHDSAAIIFMLDPARPPALPPQWIMDAYKLTKAEAQVALQGSLGHSVSTIGIGSRFHRTPSRPICAGLRQDRRPRPGGAGRPALGAAVGARGRERGSRGRIELIVADDLAGIQGTNAQPRHFPWRAWSKS